MFKTAIIGCGVIGPCHANALKKTPSIQLGAVVDIVPERAEKMGRDYGVPWFTDFKKVLRRKDIDFVSICTPSGTHGDIAIAAARAGKHVICEKPMDVTPQRCDQMIAAFQKSGTTYGGIFQHRFAADTRKARAAVLAGRLGRMALASAAMPWWRTQEYYDSGDWRGTWKLDGGGCLMNQGVHGIDLLAWLAGPIKSITARTALRCHERIEVEDVAIAVVEFQSGALGAILGTTDAYPGGSCRHQFLGDNGSIMLKDDSVDFWKLRDEEQAVGGAAPAAAAAQPDSVGAASDPAALAGDGHALNIEDIASAAREGRQPILHAEEHKKAVEIICAIYKSAQTGKTVQLPLKRFKPKA